MTPDNVRTAAKLLEKRALLLAFENNITREPRFLAISGAGSNYLLTQQEAAKIIEGLLAPIEASLGTLGVILPAGIEEAA